MEMLRITPKITLHYYVRTAIVLRKLIEVRTEEKVLGISNGCLAVALHANKQTPILIRGSGVQVSYGAPYAVLA